MNCSEVVARFTDYMDGTAADAEVEAIDAHLERCGTCARYRNVLVNGADLLRELPEVELREDFEPRLRHRLYSVDDERLLSVHASSGATGFTVLGIAMLLTAVAWSPAFFGGAPAVELEPIVVDSAPRKGPIQAASATGTFSSKGELDVGLWENTLIYYWSPLSQRYERPGRARRAGLDR